MDNSPSMEMRIVNRWLPSVVLFCIGVAGCAGFRGGWESIPYVGEIAPQLTPSETAFEAQQRLILQFPGLELGVSLSNRQRTYDTKLYFGLPLSFDPRSVNLQPAAPGKTRAHLRIIAEEGGVAFRPREARLAINREHFRGETGFEFGMWSDSGERVSTGGRWHHRDVGDEFILMEPGRAYLLSIDFPVPAPSPESPGITLDLAAALVRPGRPALPLIRFVPVRWKEGYT